MVGPLSLKHYVQISIIYFLGVWKLFPPGRKHQLLSDDFSLALRVNFCLTHVHNYKWTNLELQNSKIDFDRVVLYYIISSIYHFEAGIHFRQVLKFWLRTKQLNLLFVKVLSIRYFLLLYLWDCVIWFLLRRLRSWKKTPR